MEFTVRQEEIILKSMEIIAREGIAALTIKNISGKVGVSEAALYRHFKNKDEILLSIFDLFEKGRMMFLTANSGQGLRILKIFTTSS